MITDKELQDKIEELGRDYKGQIDDLYQIVGMVVMGRLFGWRVIRMVASRRLWNHACVYFGDLKSVLPERGRYATRSAGLRVVDELGGYWDFIKGGVNKMTSVERKTIG